MTKQELQDMILAEAEKGNVVFNTWDGLYTTSLDKFVEQPTDGLLYDLNRDKVTVLSFIEDEKWINDFAVALVIGKLKALLEEERKKHGRSE